MKVRIGFFAAARYCRVAVSRFDQHRRKKKVVGPAGARGTGRERGAGGTEHIDEIRRRRGRHQPRHHGRQDAPHVLRFAELLLDLDVGPDVAGARPHHHREVAPRQTRLSHRPSRGGKGQS
jgi:hypothetical protein